ncbi:MAG TPA: DNA mismatch repair endonuclease MutL, partial [Blastocatellia bacterium]|nr:DNA mismatch repair endonuclease MutL [Blastocatellia bacterium]
MTTRQVLWISTGPGWWNGGVEQVTALLKAVRLGRRIAPVQMKVILFEPDTPNHMAKVRIMPDALANKIAAGEVVERPASVVKELLENALDAGASQINIEIESGGKRLIRISDDGEGMTRDDAITAFERHATSKIKSEDDLESITTLGFRGEALPSIAAVSKLAIRTGLCGQAGGTEIQFSGGKMTAVKDVAWPGGTEVEVKDLFFNVPARRKFLKSDATETFHIAILGQHYALANHKIGFLVIRDGRDVIRATPASSLKERAYQVLGPELVAKLNEVDFEVGGIRVFGFASNPQEQRSSRDAQYLFVNGRFVRDQLVARALADSYRSTMPAGTYPAAILFIEVPSTDVDVNVHPAKTEVKFLQEGAVLSAVRAAVTKSLESSRTITRVPEPKGMPEKKMAGPYGTSSTRPGWAGSARTPELTPGSSGDASAEASSDLGPVLRPAGVRSSIGALDSPSPTDFGRMPGGGDAIDHSPQEESGFILSPPDESESRPSQPSLDLSFLGAAFDSSKGTASDKGLFTSDHHRQSDDSGSCGTGTLAAKSLEEPLPGLGHGIKPLGQIRDSYIVATDEEGLLLIDQHVAHERVLFEQFRDGKLSRSTDSQPLLIPQTLDLSPAEAEAFSFAAEELDGMGLETMQLSGRTIAIKAAPAGLGA